MNNVQQIIKEICDEKNINVKLLSKDWIMMLEKDNKFKYIVGYKFPLNNQAVGKICDDKYALFEVLKQCNIPVAEHYIVFRNYSKEDILEYAKKYSFNLVVKNNTGTCGNDMYHTLDEAELFKKLDEILLKKESVSISPFYDIKTEYRTIVLNGNAELVYGKKKPIVVGDGKSTIYELLCKFNYKYFARMENDDKLKRVLNVDEKFEYNWQFNLSKGSVPFMLDDYIKEEKIKQIAITIANIIDVKFASVDIIELRDGKYILLEANSGVMMDKFSEILPNGRNIAKTIYTKVIDEMFKKET